MKTNEVFRGLTSVKLVNRETGEAAEYTVADVECARMLAAEDLGGEPKDWIEPGRQQTRRPGESRDVR